MFALAAMAGAQTTFVVDSFYDTVYDTITIKEIVVETVNVEVDVDNNAESDSLKELSIIVRELKERISDVLSVVKIGLTIIAILLVIGGYLTYRNAKADAREAALEAINVKTSELDAEIEKLRKKVKDACEEVEKLKEETKISIDAKTEDLFAAIDAVKSQIEELPGKTEEETLKIGEEVEKKLEELTADDWFSRGYLSKDYYEQISCYTIAIMHNPNFAQAYSNRGVAKNMLGDYDEAMDDFKKALDFCDDDRDKFFTYNHLGLAKIGKSFSADDKEEERKWLKEAKKDFEEARHLRPEHEIGKNNFKLIQRLIEELDEEDE